MAKEMMIIFVYDTQFVETNETDLSSAIVYFHPSWVSDQQKTSLCGQIIGTTHCLKTIFSCARILALQSGKFCICDYGRYVLVVGSDRNIADWVLEYRTHILSSFVTFFHKDLQAMSELYQNSNFSTKLYYMFETYLNVLMYGGNMFFNVPSIQLPKSASNVFLEAIQILRVCQKVEYVLGGTILYHNKVVATQLTSNITKWLILTDPYHIKSPAEIIKTDFQLPTGMQLLRVYIQEMDYEELKLESERLRSVHQCLQNRNSNIQPKTNQVKEPVLMTMKRDQSLIFTTVPEEGSENVAHTTKTQRPKFLNLKSKATDLKQEPREITNNFFGNISICSTPMADLNKVLHQTSLSICTNPEVNKFAIDNQNNSPKSDSLNSLLSATSGIYDESTKNDLTTNVENMDSYLVTNNLYNIKKSLSLTDIVNLKINDKKDEFELVQKKLRRTIMDPTFPVFTSKGLLISQHLYNYNIFNEELLSIEIIDKLKKPQNTENNKDVSIAEKENPQCESRSSMPLKKFVQSRDNNKFRKSLTLPLKSLSNESSFQANVGNFNKCSGVQLTPLLSKLSALAMEERSSGFCSIETTPNDFQDMKSTLKRNILFRSNSLKIENNTCNPKEKKLQSVILLIYGQQDMVINLLLEDEIATCADAINQIYQISINHLAKLEKLIHCCLELCPGGNTQNEGTDPYSYLCMNSLWDTIKKGGPWNSLELGALTHLHRDFINIKNLTEILLRDDDGIIYAHNCGKTEVYYHQSAASSAGLPTPVDPMSIIALKAKRRLERDHSIVLL